MVKPANVDEYIMSFPGEVRQKLQALREEIRNTAAGAQEVISYGMPAYKLQGILVYFAGYERHIGFYPMPSAIEKFKSEIAGYKSAKGSVQFPLDKALPLKLVRDMVEYRVQENLDNAALKKTKN